MDEINLKDILKDGTVIRTKHCESRSWVTNVVYGISNDCVEIDIGLEKNYIDNLIMTGDTIKLKYTNDSHEYTFLGWVTRIKADFPQSITIRIHQVERFENKRNCYRFDVYLSSVIKQNATDSKGIFAIMSNISRSGAAFVLGEELEKIWNIEKEDLENILFFFDIYISPEKLLSFEGTVLREVNMDKGIEYGVKIIDMDIESEKLLNDFIIELENKDKEFYNKRSGFWSKNSKYNK